MWDMSKQQTENSIGWMAREHWTDLQEPILVFYPTSQSAKISKIDGAAGSQEYAAAVRCVPGVRRPNCCL